MEFDSIQYFITLAHCKNFSQTAEIMNVTQSTISRHIKNLESELGVKLFDSRYRTAELSQSGKIMLEYFESYIQDYQSVLYRAQRYATHNNSLIVLVLEDLDSSVVLSPIIRFQSDPSNSQISLHIETTSPFQLSYYLNKGIFDIIITLEDNFYWANYPRDSINKHVIATGEMHLYYSAKHPSVKSDRQPILSDFVGSQLITTNSFNQSHISDQNVLIYTETGPMSIIKYYTQILGFEPQISYKKDFNEILLNLESGSGFVIASQFSRFNNSDQINHIPTGAPSKIVAAWKKNNKNPLIQKVIDFFNQIETGLN